MRRIAAAAVVVASAAGTVTAVVPARAAAPARAARPAVVVLNGENNRLNAYDAATGRKQTVIRSEADDKSSTTNVRLIPYYAWANRGASEMTVWMPRD